MPESEAEQKAVMDDWTAWYTKLGGAVVDAGNPFTPMAKSVASDGKVSDGPAGSMASGYTVIQADSLDAAAVIGFVVARTSTQSRGAARLTVTALRSVLGYLHVEGVVSCALVGAVPAVAGWRLAGLPKGITPAAVRALVASCDRRTSLGRRDHAVLTMLVRLGVRAGEVAALRLEDIDWRGARSCFVARALRWTPCPCRRMSARPSPSTCGGRVRPPPPTGRSSYVTARRISGSVPPG